MLGWSKAVMGWLWSKVKNWGSKVFDIMQEGKKFFHMKENALLYYDEISLGWHLHTGTMTKTQNVLGSF